MNHLEQRFYLFIHFYEERLVSIGVPYNWVQILLKANTK